MEIDNVLRGIYYDVKNPAGLSTGKKLYTAARESLPKLTLKKVNDWLSGEFTHTLHKPIRKKFERNPIVVEVVDQQWEADLVDMQEFKKKNKNFNYILTVIDVMSKYAWGIPLKDKKGQTVVSAFRYIFKSNRMPVFLRTDQGKEFVNKPFQEFLKSKNIYHFTSKDKEIKCAVVERFNRTLKGRMFKYFTSKGTRKWFDVIEDLLSAYNNTKHRTIKMTPNQASETDSNLLFQRIYNAKNYDELYSKSNLKDKLKVKDKVRKKYETGVFDKSYYPNWSDQIFDIDKKITQPVKAVFKLEDEDNRLYPEQIQKVVENEYRIEKIIKKRKRQGREECLVKWLNYPETFNSWINVKDVHKL